MKRLTAYLAVPVIYHGIGALLVCVAAFLLLDAAVAGPNQEERESLRSDVLALHAEKRALQTRVDAVITYDERLRAVDAVEARLRAPIDRSGVVQILAELSAVSDTQIIHGANSFGPPRGNLRPVLQDLTVEGSYANIARFIDGIGGIDTLTLLRQADVSANADGTLVRAQLKLMTLSYEVAE